MFFLPFFSLDDFFIFFFNNPFCLGDWTDLVNRIIRALIYAEFIRQLKEILGLLLKLLILYPFALCFFFFLLFLFFVLLDLIDKTLILVKKLFLFLLEKIKIISKSIANISFFNNSGLLGSTGVLNLTEGDVILGETVQDFTELDNLEVTLNCDDNNKPVTHIYGKQNIANHPKYEIITDIHIDYPKTKPFTFYNEKMDGVKWSSYPGFWDKLFGSKIKTTTKLRFKKIFYNINNGNHVGVKIYNKTYDTKKWFFWSSKRTEKWIRYDYFNKKKIIKSECFKIDTSNTAWVKEIFSQIKKKSFKKSPHFTIFKIKKYF